MQQLTDEQQRAVDEFRHQAEKLVQAVEDENYDTLTGIRYALEMAAEECKLLGIDPSTITPTGFSDSESS